MAETGGSKRRGKDAGPYSYRAAFPPPIRAQVKAFFARGWKRSPAPYGEDAILADLTAPLRSALLCSIGMTHRARLPLLAALGDECLGHIVTLLWTMPLVRCACARVPVPVRCVHRLCLRLFACRLCALVCTVSPLVCA